MNKQIRIAVLLCLSLMALMSCQTQQSKITGLKTDDKRFEVIQEVFHPIFAGQNIQIGQVSVINDEENFYITYIIENEEWWLDLTHIHIAKTLSGIPQTGTGNPKPGHFAYQTAHDPAVQMYIYEIPRSAYKNGQELIFAIHADVRRINPVTGQTIQSETAWAGEIRGPGSRWWYYFKYRLQEPWRSIDDSIISTEVNESNPVVFDK